MRISDWSSDVCSSDLSQGLACLATRVAAIPELVDDGVTGVLVPPDNPAALAAALARLIADPAERRRLGAAGQQRVRADFDMKSGIDTLARLMGSADGPGAGARQAAEEHHPPRPEETAAEVQ